MKLSYALVLLLPVLLLTGCVGYVDGGYGGYGDYGGYYGGDPGPDIYLFGGDYDRGRDAQAYSHRGSESRGAAHLGGMHGGGGHGGGHRR